MKRITIGANDAGQRLDRFLAKAMPLLPGALAQKYIRLKRIKVNGTAGKRDTRLNEGDELCIYINDEYFERPTGENAYLAVNKPELNIVYEDDNIMLCNKPAGMSVHADSFGAIGTLIANIQAYLFQTGKWDPKQENTFVPALCNRIDRNTCGIVIAAKNAEALRDMDGIIRANNVHKEYICITTGTLKERSGRLENYLFKDAKQNRVYVRTKPEQGAKKAITLYETLSVRQGMSLVRCRLITGRTHQIRAQLAAAGAPLLGDGKYGRTGRGGPMEHQALCSYKLTFDPQGELGCLSYLAGRSFKVTDCDFVTRFFPEFSSRLFAADNK